MKIFKSIISLLLVFALVFTNVRLDFPVVTEYNETVAVDETVQLRIPVHASGLVLEVKVHAYDYMGNHRIKQVPSCYLKIRGIAYGAVQIQ